MIRRNKYGAKKAYSSLVGRRFDSQAERARAEELVLLEKAGEIAELEFQKTFGLKVNGRLVCTYRADFCYVMRGPDDADSFEGEYVVEDVKGFVTPEYRIKAKLFHAIFGFPIYETHPRYGRGLAGGRSRKAGRSQLPPPRRKVRDSA